MGTCSSKGGTSLCSFRKKNKLFLLYIEFKKIKKDYFKSKNFPTTKKKLDELIKLNFTDDSKLDLKQYSSREQYKEIQFFYYTILEENLEYTLALFHLNKAFSMANTNEKEKFKKLQETILEKIYDCSKNEYFKIINETIDKNEYLLAKLNDDFSILDITTTDNFYILKKHIDQSSSEQEKNSAQLIQQVFSKKFKAKLSQNIDISQNELKEALNIILPYEPIFINYLINVFIENYKKCNSSEISFLERILLIVRNKFVNVINLENAKKIMEVLIEILQKLVNSNISPSKLILNDNYFFAILRKVSETLDNMMILLEDTDLFFLDKNILKNSIESLQLLINEKLKNFPVLIFQSNYALQSLLRISEGEPFYKKNFIDLRLNETRNIQVNKNTYSQNLEALPFYDFNAHFVLGEKQIWYEDSRRIYYFIEANKTWLLEAELKIKFKEKLIDSNYLFAVITKFIENYENFMEDSLYKLIKNIHPTSTDEILSKNNILDFTYHIIEEVFKLSNIESETKNEFLLFFLSFLKKNISRIEKIMIFIENTKGKISSEIFSLKKDEDNLTFYETIFEILKKMKLQSFEIIEIVNKKFTEIELIKEISCSINNAAQFMYSDSLYLEDSLLNTVKLELKKKDFQFALHSFIQERMKNIYENDFLQQIEKLYIAQKGSESQELKDPFSLLEYFETNFLNSSKKVFLLIGASGIGKTTFSQYLENNLLKKNYKTIFIPIWINLKTLKNSNEKLIEEIFEKHNLQPYMNHLKTENIIFILDGLDEINQINSIIKANNLDQFRNAKFLVTCNQDYFNSSKLENSSINFFFPQIPEELFTLTFLMPFDNNDKIHFMNNYLNLKPEAEEKEKFILKQFETIFIQYENLAEITTNPLILFMICKIVTYLPNLISQKTKLKKFDIYNQFIKYWFKNKIENYQFNRINNNDENISNSNSDEKLNESVNELFKLCVEFSIDIFLKTKLNFNNQLLSNFNNLTYTKDQLIKTFDKLKCVNNNKSEYMNDFIKWIPIKKVGENQFDFIHNSIIEFFISFRILEEFNMIDDENFNVYSSFEKLLFNQLDISKYPGILAFIIESFEDQPDFEKKLWKFVFDSKYRTDIDYLSSNSITILNYSNKVLFCKDYSNVRIPFADIRSSVLKDCNFSNCLMSYCNLMNSDISYCNFTNADLSNAKIINNNLQNTNLKKHVCLSGFKKKNIEKAFFLKENKYFLTISTTGSLDIYEVSNNFFKIKEIQIKDSCLSKCQNKLIVLDTDDLIKILNVENNFEEIKKFQQTFNNNLAKAINNKALTILKFSNNDRYLVSLSIKYELELKVIFRNIFYFYFSNVF